MAINRLNHLWAQLWVIFGVFVMAYITSILSSTLTNDLLASPEVGYARLLDRNLN